MQVAAHVLFPLEICSYHTGYGAICCALCNKQARFIGPLDPAFFECI